MIYMFFMLFGVCIFAAGIVFERMSYCEVEEKADADLSEEADPEMLRQWENLLGYDGNEQEEDE